MYRYITDIQSVYNIDYLSMSIVLYVYNYVSHASSPNVKYSSHPLLCSLTTSHPFSEFVVFSAGVIQHTPATQCFESKNTKCMWPSY
jgi:hypothetical protein